MAKDAWKHTMHIVAEHEDSIYPTIADEHGNHISFDERATTRSPYWTQPLYIVRVGIDRKANRTAEPVSRFLDEKGVDASKFH
jgi:hypothetical protein